VQAININSTPGAWSAARNFTIDILPPPVPVLKSPFDFTVVTAIPTYSWAASAGANAYQFQYDGSPSFTSPDYESSVLTVTTHKPISQSFGVFYWRVRARDAAGNWSLWSTPRKLIITPL